MAYLRGATIPDTNELLGRWRLAVSVTLPAGAPGFVWAALAIAFVLAGLGAFVKGFAGSESSGSSGSGMLWLLVL
jgi:hypothetical protein